MDLDGKEGPFTVDYEANPRITLKAVVKGGDGTTITDAVWKTDGTIAYSLQNNGDGTCTLTAQRRGSTFSAYDGVFTLRCLHRYLCLNPGIYTAITSLPSACTGGRLTSC